MNGASPSNNNYSTNGRVESSPDEGSPYVELRATREEAEFILRRRKGQFRLDPAAAIEAMVDHPKPPDKWARWGPVPISQLHSEGGRVDYILEGLIVKGHKTSFTGLWKSGKTTWLQYVLRSMDGETARFCGLAVRAAKVLVVSEEIKSLWIERRDKLGLSDNVHLITLPFRKRPHLKEWNEFLDFLANAQRVEEYDLVVFDSMHNLWGVRDENNNAEVLEYLTPLNQLAEQGAALLLIAHPSKSDANEGRATRGGGAWGGFVDVILEMRRYDPSKRDDPRRVLNAYSRWEETPSELVIELDLERHEYLTVGSKSDAHAKDRMSIYSDILPKEAPGKTPDEIRSEWSDRDIPRPAVRTITRDLDAAAAQGKVRISGTGVKNDPKRYSILDT